MQTLDLKGLTRFKELLDKQVKGVEPIGTMIFYGGTEIPEGYLLCDGSELSRETYAELFNVIGEKFGSGDEESTFNIPDMSDRFVKGSSTPGTTASAGLPDISGTLKPITGGYNTYVSSSGAFSSSNYGSFTYYGSGSNAYQSTINLNASSSNSIYGASSTVEPPSITLRACIKYQ